MQHTSGLSVENDAETLRQDLATLLRGGFAPVVILLREFHFDKAAIVLDGLPYSAWSLLEHMRRRQTILLNFMKDPGSGHEVWPEAYWPENPDPQSKERWDHAIDEFEAELEEVIQLVKDPETPLFEKQQNGQTLFWAAVAILQHNGYHIGQIKAIGRQLGVW